MTTRSNFYKKPSITYKKDLSLSSVLQNLHAYNAATVTAPPPENPPPAANSSSGAHKRRQRDPKPPPAPFGAKLEIEERDGAMSHQSYIDKRSHCPNSSLSKEAFATSAFEELTDDVLGKPGASGLGVILVQYGYDDSDESSSSDCEEKQDFLKTGEVNERDGVKSRTEQRFPQPGEPVCVMCGKY